MKKIIPLIISTMFAGCTAGPDYTKPQTYTTNSYTREQISQQFIAGQKLAGNWWQIFKAPVLDELISKAFSNNLDINAAIARLKQANEILNATSSEYWPQIKLEANINRQKIGAATTGSTAQTPTFTGYKIGPTISIPFDFFGLIRRSVEKQEALTRYYEHQLNAAYLTLSANITMQLLLLAAANSQRNCSPLNITI
jgi:outer membrane protein TolC